MNEPTRSQTPGQTGEASIQGAEPKPGFEEPRLAPRGDLREVTGFFGGFSP